jgi:glycosyltransferase involved in cell wall biosynthesis
MTSPKTHHRIGIDCRMYSSQFTGIGRYVFELVENLQKIDQNNDYFLFFNQPEFDNFQATNPRFHKVLVNAKHYSLAEQTKFLRILNNHHLDLMHFTHFNAPILYHRPSIVTIHDLTLHFFPGKKMTSPLHRLAYGATIRASVYKAKKIIAVSRGTGKDLEKVLHIPLSKIQMIYEGINPDFKPLNNPARLQSTLTKYQIQKPFLLYTGVWRSHKNIAGLLQAFAKLRKKHDLQLVITGRKDNIYAKEIFQKAQSLGLMPESRSPHSTPLVVFPGLVSEHELVDLLNAAQLFVFPSFYEGFGLPALEAMQCATPVAVSNTSCLPEICGNNAVYFDPYSPSDMAEKISNLLKDQALQEKLIHSGLEHVKKFSWSKMAHETHQLYLHAISAKK